MAFSETGGKERTQPAERAILCHARHHSDPQNKARNAFMSPKAV